MADLAVSTPTIDGFFRRWEASGAAERANYSMFLNELCDLLDVPRPDPAGPDDEKNAYVFERAVPFPNPDGSTTVKRIDLYKRDCFVLEAKQGSDRVEATEPFSLAPHRRMRRGTAVRGTAGWDAAMYEAKGQAELYVRNLPASEHNPPFIIVADVGHSMELFSDFSRQGRTYIPFPDPRTHRLKLRDLAEAEIRERLKQVWTEPLTLDPSRRTAKVTREVAAELAELARSLEHSGYAPDLVAHFLMRCLFTFFAEDVGLLPKDCFTAMLSRLREEGRITAFSDMAGSLWATMKTGGFSPILMQSVLRFNGGLFDQATALPLTDEQIGLLIDSGRKQWREDEPAIFGTLLERVLDKNERHKLGAHFTPRAYVERLVLPTIVEPLREQWGSGRGHLADTLHNSSSAALHAIGRWHTLAIEAGDAAGHPAHFPAKFPIRPGRNLALPEYRGAIEHQRRAPCQAESRRSCPLRKAKSSPRDRSPSRAVFRGLSRRVLSRCTSWPWGRRPSTTTSTAEWTRQSMCWRARSNSSSLAKSFRARQARRPSFPEASTTGSPTTGQPARGS